MWMVSQPVVKEQCGQDYSTLGGIRVELGGKGLICPSRTAKGHSQLE